MKFCTMSRADLHLPLIGMGTMGIGGYLQANHVSDQAFVDGLKLGIDLGMTLIDTAEVYGAGHSETLVGRAITGQRGQVFVVSKVSPENLATDALIRSCENSLKRLNVDCIDLYQVHWPNPAIPIAQTMAAMRQLHAQGKIRYAGVSNFSGLQLQAAHHAFDHPAFLATEDEYNLFDRTAESRVMPYCVEQGLLFLAYSPLHQGKLAVNPVMAELSQKYGKTPSQLALAWLTGRPNVIAIPKAARAEHLRENAASCFEIEPGDRARIDKTFATRPILAPVDRIKVVPDGVGNRQAYQTIEQAIENPMGFTPSPKQLADDIAARNEPIKPIRVRRRTIDTGKYDYDLMEGRVRYWAWVIAHRGEKPIPVLVLD